MVQVITNYYTILVRCDDNLYTQCQLWDYKSLPDYVVLAECKTKFGGMETIDTLLLCRVL